MKLTLLKDAMKNAVIFCIFLGLLNASCQTTPVRAIDLEQGLLQDLFGNPECLFDLRCGIDLLEGDLSSSHYDFYIYQITEGNVILDSIIQYPHFAPQFYEIDTAAVDKVVRSRWKATPLRPEDNIQYQRFATSMNLLEHECSRAFIETKAVDQEGNYYAYLNGYPTGAWFYLYQPTTATLAIFRSKG